MAEAPAKQSYSTDPALYLYTSLTAGSSHIVTATSRLETILKANRVPFKAIDLATDQKARMLWGRRAGKDEGGRVRKLPGLVQMGMVLGDLVEIEEWNEYGELKQHVKIYYDEFTIPPKGAAQIPNPLRKPVYGNSIAASASKPAASASASTAPKPVPAAPPLPGKKENESVSKKTEEPKKAPVAPGKSIAEEAAQKAKQVRLEGLRKAVQNDKDKAAAAAAAAAGPAASKDGTSDEKKTATPATEPSAVATTPTATKAKEAPTNSGTGLQSPTSGRWATNPIEDSLGNVLQSPTSGTWKSGGSNVSLPIREHRGSAVVEASKEEIAAIEKSEAIPEAAVEESDEDEEDDDDDDDDDEDGEEDDDDSDEDDDDESEEEEEQQKKTQKK